jgi:hypothetical protein
MQWGMPVSLTHLLERKKTMSDQIKEIEATISQQMHKQLAAVGGEVRGSRAKRNKQLIQEGKLCLDFQNICLSYGRTRTSILSYAKSHMGMTAGLFDKMCNIGRYMVGPPSQPAINPKLLPFCDPAVFLYIARLPEEEIPGKDGALRAYTDAIWSHMEKRHGVYLRGKIVDLATYRWTEWHKRYVQRKQQDSAENAVQCRTGRIEAKDATCGDVTITFKVIGAVGKKPTAAQARKAVNCLFNKGEIVFD